MMRWWAAAVVGLGLVSCQMEKTEREIGYKGKARVDPWLAAERLSSRMGYDTRSVLTWKAPDRGDAVWILPAVVLSNASYVGQTERWVGSGGHLVLLVDHADAETNDWHGFHMRPELADSFKSFLTRTGITLDEGKETTSHEVEFDGGTYKVDAQSKFSVSAGAGKPGALASVRMGNGRVTVLTDARIFRNRWIAEHDHAALLDALASAGVRQGRVVFMRGTRLSLWVMLKRYLWPLLVALAVWTCVWLWKNLTRFGPLESPAPQGELRGYEHHLEALGDFQWRLDRAASLLVPLREQVVELGQRASVVSGRRDEDFFQFLGDRAGITRERAFRALVEAAPADASVLTRTTADLQQLLKTLQHPAHS